MMHYKNKYEHIVSFGCMCSCARFLQINGFRSTSSFFDWIDSNIEANIKIVRNNFADVLNRKYLAQKYPTAKNCITNTLYNVTFVHLFDAYKTFDEQYQDVKTKSDIYISRFKQMINESLLLVYYCRSVDEQNWIIKNQKEIKKFCSDFNVDVAFIFNKSIDNEFFDFKSFIIPVNNIHKPFGGAVSWPFEQTDEIVSWLSDKYDLNKKNQNIHFFESNDNNDKRNVLNFFRRFKREKLLL